MDYKLREELDRQTREAIGKIASGSANEYDVGRLHSLQMMSIRASRFTVEMAMDARRKAPHIALK